MFSLLLAEQDVEQVELSLVWDAMPLMWRHCNISRQLPTLLSGVPDYFGRNKISSGGDLSHYSSASLY